MHILVNGDPLEVQEDANVSTLIEHLKLAGKRLAVELNGEIIPRSAHAQTPLHAQDRVEIVQAIGGG